MEMAARFLEQLAASESWQALIQARRHEDEADASMLVAFGAEQGFSFSEEELRAVVGSSSAIGPSGELSDASLTAVAGGGNSQVVNTPNSYVAAGQPLPPGGYPFGSPLRTMVQLAEGQSTYTKCGTSPA